MVCVDKSQPGRTVWKMRADERFANPAENRPGRLCSALADSAMGSATVTFAAAREHRVFSANVEMKTSFMAPARIGETLECVAEVVSGGSRVAFVEAEVTDSTGRMVGRASSTYLLTPREARPPDGDRNP